MCPCPSPWSRSFSRWRRRQPWRSKAGCSTCLVVLYELWVTMMWMTISMFLLCSDPLTSNKTLADFLKREKERIKVLLLVFVITMMMVVEGKRQRFTRKMRVFGCSEDFCCAGGNCGIDNDGSIKSWMHFLRQKWTCLCLSWTPGSAFHLEPWSSAPRRPPWQCQWSLCKTTNRQKMSPWQLCFTATWQRHRGHSCCRTRCRLRQHLASPVVSMIFLV